MRTRAIGWSPCWLALLLAGCDYLGLGGGRGPVFLSAPVIYLNQGRPEPGRIRGTHRGTAGAHPDLHGRR